MRIKKEKEKLGVVSDVVEKSGVDTFLCCRTSQSLYVLV